MGTEFHYKRRGKAERYPADEILPENDNHAEDRREVPALAGAETAPVFDGNNVQYLWADDGIYSPTAGLTFADDLIEGLLPEVGVGLFTGASGAYKTFNGIRVCVDIATGSEFAGHKVERPGGTLYLGYEGFNTIEPRLSAALIDIGQDHKKWPIAVPPNPVRFNHATAYEELENSLVRLDDRFRRDFGVPLVFACIDTVAASGLIEDEYNPGQWQTMMSRLSDICQYMRMSIAVVAHAGKDASKGARGSSANYAAADYEISFSAALDKITGETSGRLMSLTKSRDGQSFPIAAMSGEPIFVGKTEKGKHKYAMAMRYDTSPEAIATAKAEQAQFAAKSSGQAKSKAGKPLTHEQKVHKLLSETIDSGEGIYFFSEKEGPKTFLSETWLQTEYMKMEGITMDSPSIARNSISKGFKRALTRLQTDKKAIVDGGSIKLLQSYD
jgi:hypothetical protein